MVFTSYMLDELDCHWVQPRWCRDHHLHIHTHISASAASVSTVHSPNHYTSATSLCSHPLLVMILAQVAPPFLLNIFAQELDYLNHNSPVMFQLCAAEKVNTDHYFTIQVYFKLGL
jgi:hypothetical protein